jgi:hypothetical protein
MLSKGAPGAQAPYNACLITKHNCGGNVGWGLSHTHPVNILWGGSRVWFLYISEYPYQVVQSPTSTLSPGLRIFPSNSHGHCTADTHCPALFKSLPSRHWHPGTHSSLHAKLADKSRQLRAHDEPHSVQISSELEHCCAEMIRKT